MVFFSEKKALFTHMSRLSAEEGEGVHIVILFNFNQMCNICQLFVYLQRGSFMRGNLWLTIVYIS